MRLRAAFKLIPFFALLCFASLSGCSLRKIALNHADWFIVRKVDTYFDLESEQKAQLKKRVKENFALIKKDMLPRVVVMLKELQQRSQDNLSEDDVTWLNSKYAEFRVELFSLLSNDIAAFIQALKPSQVENFAKELEESNEKFRELLALNDTKLAKKLLEQRMDGLEDFFGGFSAIQEEAVGKVIDLDRVSVERRLQVRRGMQEAVVALCGKKSEAQDLGSTVKTWAAAPQRMLSPEASQIYLENWQRNDGVMLAIDKILTAEQRQHFIKKIQDLIEDLEDLILEA